MVQLLEAGAKAKAVVRQEKTEAVAEAEAVEAIKVFVQ